MSTTPPIERTASVPTRLGRLHVRHYGPATGRPTVFWSSMFVDSHTWDRVIPLLQTAAPDRALVLVDPPGLGLSEPLRRRSSVSEAAGAARDVLVALRSRNAHAGAGASEAPDWVGNAFGGHVGFELAAEPGLLRSLAAISSPAEAIPTALRSRIRLLQPLLRAAGAVGPVRNAVIGAMLTDASAADPRIRQLVVDSLARPGRRSLALALQSFILDRTDVTRLLPRIQAPSLFVASDDRGDWGPAEAAASAALAPGARAVTIRRARTLIPLEQPEALAEQLLAFWRGLGAGESAPKSAPQGRST